MLLFINVAFREGSRTLKLANAYLEKKNCEYETVDLGNMDVRALNTERLKIYNESVANRKYTDSMFDIPKQFCEADEIVIAAPFWNYSIPAVLHDYLELVCSQGVSFDISEDGTYFSLCKAKKITYITTAGGSIPEEDHAFGYIKSLAEVFWRIPCIQYFKAEGMDIIGADVEQKLQDVIDTM